MPIVGRQRPHTNWVTWKRILRLTGRGRKRNESRGQLPIETDFTIIKPIFIILGKTTLPPKWPRVH